MDAAAALGDDDDDETKTALTVVRTSAAPAAKLIAEPSRSAVDTDSPSSSASAGSAMQRTSSATFNRVIAADYEYMPTVDTT